MQKRDLRAARARQRIGENKKFILKAAEKIFSRSGYIQTTMDEIAREAQFSKATLYRYYRSKDEIFTAVIRASFQEALGGFQTIQQLEIGPAAKIHELIQYTLSYTKKKEKFARLFLMERSAMKKALNMDIHDHVLPGNDKKSLPDEFQQIITSFHHSLCAIIKEGVDSGEFRPVDPAEACYVLGALLRGFHFRGFMLDKDYSVDQSTALLYSFFMDGIKASGQWQKGERI